MQVFQQKDRIDCGTRQAGDGIGRTATSLALLDGVTFQANELLRAGPVEVLFVDRRGGRGDSAGFEAAAILRDSRRGLLLSQCFTHGVGAAEGGLSVASNCATAIDWRTKSLGKTNRLCRLRGITKTCSMSRRSCG